MYQPITRKILEEVDKGTRLKLSMIELQEKGVISNHNYPDRENILAKIKITFNRWRKDVHNLLLNNKLLLEYNKITNLRLKPAYMQFGDLSDQYNRTINYLAELVSYAQNLEAKISKIYIQGDHNQIANHSPKAKQNHTTNKPKWWERTWVQLLFVLGAIAGIIGLLFLFINNDVESSQKHAGIGDNIAGSKTEFNFYYKDPIIPTEQNYYLKYHTEHTYKGKKVIEVRPKQGSWYPFVVGIPINEKETTEIDLIFGPSGFPPRGGQPILITHSPSDDNQWWVLSGEGQATTDQSYYIVYKEDPTLIAFGPKEGMKYKIDMAEINKE